METFSQWNLKRNFYHYTYTQFFPFAQNNIQIPIVETIPTVQNLTVTEASTPMDLGKAGNAAGSTSAEGNGAPKKRWNRQPINKKVKRIRRNRRLRKMLIPKNALMSLNELMGSTLSEYAIVPEERGFIARVYVNNVQYEGRGTYFFWTFNVSRALFTDFSLVGRHIEDCSQK